MKSDETQEQNVFALIGGRSMLRKLVDRFYDLRDLEPEFKGIRNSYPSALDNSRDKLYWFMSGQSDGPDFYVDRFGHPRLRAGHVSYAIATNERDQGLRCMAQAMQDTGLPEQLQQKLLQTFYQTVDWIRNRENGMGFIRKYLL